MSVRATHKPAYLNLSAGALRERVARGTEALASCSLCPRACRVNRLAGETGVCHTARRAVVSSFFAHPGEEDCLRGWCGSGTIFFSWCNLRCIFCQNWDISHEGGGTPVSPERLATMMLALQEAGCHNINFVTPSHVVPQILEALPAAIEGGLRLPLVYNTGGYDSLEALALLDGAVDIYMPDLKYLDPALARNHLKAPGYPEVARWAFKEMHRQVGDLVLDDRGLAVRGLLVRHLVMPDQLEDSARIFKFLAEEISRDTFVNVMPQYRPAGQADEFGELTRPTSRAEWHEALALARRAGLHRFDPR